MEVLSVEAIMTGKEGLWPVLLKHAPVPEHREMELVVGSQRIRRNKNLWAEVTTLRQIFAEVSGLGGGEGGARSGEAATLGGAVQGLLGRIQSTHPTGCSISLPTIQTFRMEIQHTLDCEQRYLEAEVAALTASLDAEADSISERPCTAASIQTTDSALSDQPARPGGLRSCPGLGESPTRKVSKVRSRLPCKSTYTVVDVESGAEEPVLDGELSPVRRSGNSKFRNKLQAAKDENYFIEDFELGVS